MEGLATHDIFPLLPLIGRRRAAARPRRTEGASEKRVTPERRLYG
jgi:hypothetical protein